VQSLVADRARFQRRILLLLLEGMGIRGEEAESFEAARKVLGEVDLSFLDLSILPASPPPGWRGSARRIVVTGEAARDEALAKWIEAGADGFLCKPFTRDRLARVLEDLDLDLESA
jgi:CheY-like chemotaxis protein